MVKIQGRAMLRQCEQVNEACWNQVTGAIMGGAWEGENGKMRVRLFIETVDEMA
jgi:hypothetical protein